MLIGCSEDLVRPKKCAESTYTKKKLNTWDKLNI